jgi:FG-GAP-like repeat
MVIVWFFGLLNIYSLSVPDPCAAIDIFTNSGQALGSSDTTAVALGDLDGDNDLDALVMNYQNEPDRVWLNDGNGSFTDSGQVIEFSCSSSIALGDLDGDNDLDTFVGKSSANEVWLNIFTDIGDLDKDGDVDGDDLRIFTLCFGKILN